ncbi:MAG: hypothetical protein RL026_1595 [Pseudomonadota bacterium]
MALTLQDKWELQELCARYAQALDHNDKAAFLEGFTDDAVFVLGPRRCEGHGELAAFFDGRQAQGPRSTRHFFSNLLLEPAGTGEATGLSTWMSFVGTGEPPYSPATPFLVAEARDRYRLVQGRWRVAERLISIVFRQAG